MGYNKVKDTSSGVQRIEECFYHGSCSKGILKPDTSTPMMELPKF